MYYFKAILSLLLVIAYVYCICTFLLRLENSKIPLIDILIYVIAHIFKIHSTLSFGIYEVVSEKAHMISLLYVSHTNVFRRAS